jgi:hypothetical protein
VVHPSPFWTWSLVSRRHETRMAVRAVVEALCGDVSPLGLDGDAVWLPANDPHHRDRIRH